MEKSADIDQLCISTVSTLLREKRTGFASLRPGFSLRSARFPQYSSLVCCVARGPPVTCSPWRLSSRDFAVCGKPAGLVCLQHCLVAALPCPSTCRVPVRCFHGDWSTGVQTSCYATSPSLPPSVVKVVPCVRPRRHCHTSTIDITHCQKCFHTTSTNDSFPN